MKLYYEIEKVVTVFGTSYFLNVGTEKYLSSDGRWHVDMNTDVHSSSAKTNQTCINRLERLYPNAEHVNHESMEAV